MKRILFFILLFLNQIVSAKSLYMTVRRDFSPSESPQVEVNYSINAPLEIRVLKPKKMKEFIVSQIDLRRAWKKPRLEDNPAHYLLKGMNRFSLNVDWIRNSLSPLAREDFFSTFGGPASKGLHSKISEGPKKLISTPEDFEVIEELSIHPNDKDADVPFDVPGFDWWEQSYGGMLHTKEVVLPKLPVGFYVLQVIQGKLEGQVVIVVNDIKATLRQSDAYAQVIVTDRQGAPLPKASVGLRNLTGAWSADSQTDAAGTIEFKNLKDRELLAVVEFGDKGTALIDTDFYSTAAVFPDVYLYTDRPMFKPGHEVYFKGIARERVDGLSKNKSAESVLLRVIDSEGSVVQEEVKVPLSSYSSFSGNFVLDKNLSSGLYRIDARLDQEQHIGEFRVKSYVKPIFFVKIESAQETLKEGDTLKAKVQIKRYAGGVPPGTKFQAELFKVRMETPEWADSAGLGESGAEVTYGFANQEQVSTSIPHLLGRQENLAFSNEGIAQFSMKVPNDDTLSPNYDYKYLLKVTATDSDSNFASASKSFLDLKAEHMIQARMTAVMAGPAASSELRIRSVYPSGLPYPNSKGTLEWWHLPYKQKEVKLSEEKITTDQNGKWQGAVPTAPLGKLIARVTLSDKNGAVQKSESEIVMIGETLGPGIVEVHDLTIMSRKSVFEVGEKLKVLVLLPEKWGINQSDEGYLYLTLASRKVLKQRSVSVKGLSTWVDEEVLRECGSSCYFIIAYQDPQKNWIERKLSFRILNEDRILNVSMKVADDVVFPGSEQGVEISVKDQKGHPMDAELSLSVVDKAVLDLQSEIRPALMDFFYPLEKLNLMTFLSSQFQSYGYGDTIASLFRADNWKAAAKGSTQDEFVEKDTAFWNAHIKTDSQGSAKVNFRLPANQTIWHMTALAIDNSGRFGEAHKEFQAKMPINFIAVLPQFLRSGDRAVGRVTLANSSSQQEIPVSLKIAIGASLKNVEALPELDTVFKAKQEQSFKIPLEIISQDQSGSFLTSHLKVAEQKLEFKNDVLLANSQLKDQQEVSFENQSASYTLADGEKISQLRLSLQEGLSGTVIPALNWMLSYPYGCVEQLVNTTIPNIFFKTLLAKWNLDVAESKVSQVATPEAKNFLARFWASLKNWFSSVGEWVSNLFVSSAKKVRLSPKLQVQLEQAVRNANVGVEKIRAYQTSQGAYSWFEDMENSEQSFSMTSLVLLSLAPLNDADLLRRAGVDQALNFLDRYSYLQDHPSGIMMTYARIRFSKLGIRPLAWSAIETQFRFQANHVLEKGSVLEQAYALLSLGELGESATNVKEIKSQLIKSLKDSLNSITKVDDIQHATWTPIGNSWDEYPGRLGSTLAVVGHALFLASEMPAELEQKIGANLLEHFDGRSFGSTFETAQVLMHSEWLIERDVERATSLKIPRIAVNGQTISKDELFIEYSPMGLEVRLENVPVADNKQLEFKVLDEQKGKTPKKGQLIVESEYSFKNIIEKSSGFKIRRNFFRLIPGKQERQLLKSGDQVSLGDLVYVEIEMETSEQRPWWSSRYHVLSSHVPAGFQVIEEDNVYKAKPFELALSEIRVKKREMESEKVTWYLNFERAWMMTGRRLGFVMRAGFEGEFQAGTAEIKDFYDEKIMARSPAFSLRVGI